MEETDVLKINRDDDDEYFAIFYRDAIVINIVSFCTSLYAGIAVFSIIGFMAHEYKVPIADVIKSGE